MGTEFSVLSPGERTEDTADRGGGEGEEEEEEEGEEEEDENEEEEDDEERLGGPGEPQLRGSTEGTGDAETVGERIGRGD